MKHGFQINFGDHREGGVLNVRLAGTRKCIDQLACSHGFLEWHLLVVVTCCPVLGPLRVMVLRTRVIEELILTTGML